MSNSGSDRIAVLRNNQVVPLLPSLVPQGGDQPWHGVILERHTVAAIEIPEHEHRELCLHLQTEGDKALEWWSEGRHAIERTSPGSMIFLPAGTRDRLRWQGTSNRLILSIRPAVLEQIAAEADASSPEFEARWTLQDAALQQLVLEMGRQAAEGWPLGRLYAELTVAGLAGVLLRRYAANPIDTATIRGGLPMSRLRHAMEYITANLARDLSLDEIARQANLSPFHFARQFRNSTGQTAYQYLLDQRIEHAKRLLKGNSWSVQEIAHMAGFRSPVNFVRSFSQRVGQTPAAWRKAQ